MWQSSAELRPASLRPFADAWLAQELRQARLTLELRQEKEGLLLPDLQTVPPSSLRIDLKSRPGRKLLRLGNTVWNAGEGPLEVSGVPDPTSGTTRVTQNILAREGGTVEREVGGFVYHPGHAHWHFEGFSVYELWSLAPAGGEATAWPGRLTAALGRLALAAGGRFEDLAPRAPAEGSFPRLGERLLTSGKVDYCIWDNARLDASLPGAGGRRYNFANCRKEQGTQGISVGWSDTYYANTMGQFLDVTGLPNGRYALRSVANPGRVIEELDTTNNEALAYIELTGNRVRVEAVMDSSGPRMGAR